MASTGYWGQGLGGYLSDVGLQLGTTATTRYGQRQQTDHWVDAMRYMTGIGSSYKVYWDDNESKKIQDSDYYGKEGEVKTILQRLRRETRNFIGDKRLAIY